MKQLADERRKEELAIEVDEKGAIHVHAAEGNASHALAIYWNLASEYWVQRAGKENHITRLICFS